MSQRACPGLSSGEANQLSQRLLLGISKNLHDAMCVSVLGFFSLQSLQDFLESTVLFNSIQESSHEPQDLVLWVIEYSS